MIISIHINIFNDNKLSFQILYHYNESCLSIPIYPQKNNLLYNRYKHCYINIICLYFKINKSFFKKSLAIFQICNILYYNSLKQRHVHMEV